MTLVIALVLIMGGFVLIASAQNNVTIKELIQRTLA